MTAIAAEPESEHTPAPAAMPDESQERAIDMAMEAEINARDFYQNAVEKISDERGKDLLQQLADFEQGHFDKLSELRKSLADTGEYVEYGGMEFQKKVFSPVP